MCLTSRLGKRRRNYNKVCTRQSIMTVQRRKTKIETDRQSNGPALYRGHHGRGPSRE